MTEAELQALIELLETTALPGETFHGERGLRRAAALREASRGGFSQEPHEPISARDLPAEGPLSLKDLRVASKSYSDPELERWNQLPDELFKIRR